MPDPEKPSGAPRPFWVVGLLLLAAVVLVLAAALYLARSLQPAVGIAPATNTTGAGTAVAPAEPALSTPRSADAGTEPSTDPTPILSIEQAVERAYLQYWDAYAAALSTLDASRLPEVMTGAELTDARRQVDELRSQGRAARTDVEHDYVVVPTDTGRATVRDRYRNRSYTVDARTGQPLQAPGEGAITEIAAELEMEGGAWKVTRIVQLVQ